MKSRLLLLFIMGLMACSDAELVDMKQISHGAQLYKSHCANCHQEDGSGLANLIPPLKGSDYLVLHAKELPCLIQKGLKGKIWVNGKDYSLGMPAVQSLSAEELSDLCIFVYQKFPEKPIEMSTKEIKNLVKACVSSPKKL